MWYQSIDLVIVILSAMFGSMIMMTFVNWKAKNTYNVFWLVYNMILTIAVLILLYFG